MVRIRTIIEREGLFANRTATKRHYNRRLKYSMRRGLHFWRRTFLRKHFRSPAFVEAEYPGVYSKRSAGYQRRKAKEKGTTNLISWSGTTERMARFGPVTTGGTSTKAWVRLRVPTNVQKSSRGRYTTRPTDWVKTELTAVSISETRRVNRFVRADLIKNLRKVSVKHRIRIAA